MFDLITHMHIINIILYITYYIYTLCCAESVPLDIHSCFLVSLELCSVCSACIYVSILCNDIISLLCNVLCVHYIIYIIIYIYTLYNFIQCIHTCVVYRISCIKYTCICNSAYRIAGNFGEH